jgi:hypothetical protein
MNYNYNYSQGTEDSSLVHAILLLASVSYTFIQDKVKLSLFLIKHHTMKTYGVKI